MSHSGLTRAPLAPEVFPEIKVVAGVRLHSCAAEFKYTGRDDLCIFSFEGETHVAGVFTQSSAAAASVGWSKTIVQTKGTARAVVVTAGNANAFTGTLGHESVRDIAQTCAQELDCSDADILVAQTGVIGQPFPTDRCLDAIPSCLSTLVSWECAAQAITTTDTFSKGAMRQAEIEGVSVTLAGIAKGSGMIAPDMATMLGFIVCDAAIAPKALQALLNDVNEQSFNSISVDGDTSTNDLVLLFATAQAGHSLIENPDDPRLLDFKQALLSLCQELATQIVRDGEGATKFVTVRVKGASTYVDAKKIAMEVANSPLVKTALAGSDPNWGRIIMAVGKADVDVDMSKLQLYFGEQLVAEDGAVHPKYSEDFGETYFKQPYLELTIDLRTGSCAATVWTCDLSHGYIQINADYRS